MFQIITSHIKIKNTLLSIGVALISCTSNDIKIESLPSAPGVNSHSPQRITDGANLSLELLASEFQTDIKSLSEATNDLILYINKQRTFQELCGQEGKSFLCNYLGLLERYSITESQKARMAQIRLNSSNLLENQSLDYPLAARATSRISKKQMSTWVKILTTHTACPRNLSLTAIRKIEENLPSKEAFEQTEALYNHAARCVKSSDPGYEVLHFRQALLRKLFGQEDLARESIELATKAELGEEKGRSLYWKGMFAKEASDRKRIWKELTEKQPMTYHSLLAWQALGVDPMEKLEEGPKNISRVTEDLSGVLKTSVQWLEVLYLTRNGSAAERLTQKIYELDDDISEDSVLYIGALKISFDQYHNAIKFLTNRIVKDPSLLSSQLLKQLYPAPFLDIFEKYSEGVDTFLLIGLARQESAFNQFARSPARAEGVMQILPRVARHKLHSKGRVNLFDVEINIKVGSRLLRDWIGQFGSVEFALIAYNAGPLRVKEWTQRYPTQNMALFLDLIPFRETRNYVGSILRNNYWYHRIYEDDPKYKSLQSQKHQGPNTLYSRIVKDLLIAHSPAQ